MKATILLAVVVAVIVGVQEVQSVPCVSTYCARFCGSAGCSLYGCYRRTYCKMCYCLHCRRAESPLALSGSARNVNEQNKDIDNSPMMNEMEHLDQEMDMF
uniref:Myticin C n=1 Tax=Mytilus galloprovincialis TaxID=29158 RepID=H6BJA2_MYTGA|nr:myticin C [Mytilus galloprovincialis]AEZ78897.1 myticin C [Mytilus galloprovincialis]AEZ78898.1 myticin C [Mytilus galloprovincialis]AEZ78900.1 myticin C [Mytilus galloprovincialis]AEZ78905.1 myticin C [Mytilus galloprovincialis]